MLRPSLEIDPRESEPWILKGLGFCSMERYHEAINCFEEAGKLGDTSTAERITDCRNLHAEW